MTAETILLPRRHDAPGRSAIARFRVALVSWFRRRRHEVRTRRQLLLVNARLLKDVGLDDEPLREARKRYRGVRSVIWPLPPDLQATYLNTPGRLI